MSITHTNHFSSHPILEGIGKVLHNNQEKKAAEQRQHDELIRKTQELKDREQTINKRELNRTIDNIINSISKTAEKQQDKKHHDQLAQKDRELQERENDLHEQQARIKKNTWEQQQKFFANNYYSIKSRAENNKKFGGGGGGGGTFKQEDLESLYKDISNTMSQYDQNAYHATFEEQHMRAQLVNIQTSIALYQKWQNEREFHNLITEEILSKSQNISVNEIDQIVISLDRCLYKYNHYKECLNSTEQLHLSKIPGLINQLKKQQQIHKLEIQRQIDRSKANVAEQHIQKYLTDSYDALYQGQLENALKWLEYASDENKNISNWSDVSQDLKDKMNKLNVSIKILQDEIKCFKQRRKVNSLKLSTIIIDNGIHKSKYRVKTLLNRHYMRLQISICADLRRNWHKFDQDTWLELFDQISQLITNELIETTFLKRWAPLNWTDAALYLNRSKLIAPEISLLIDSWVVTSPVRELIELPVFTIPVAKIVN